MYGPNNGQNGYQQQGRPNYPPQQGYQQPQQPIVVQQVQPVDPRKDRRRRRRAVIGSAMLASSLSKK